MRQKISNNGQQLLRSTFVLGLAALSILIIYHYSGSQHQVIVSRSNVINALGSNLTGSAYLSTDSSAYSDSKVTFGNPNSVFFYSNKTASSTIKIDTANPSYSTPISPLDYGANIVWYDGGYGIQDPTTNQLYSSVVQLTKNIGISALRYPGGIPSDTFNWQIAVGPQNSRSNNVVYQSQDVFLPSSFGPDEFGQFLQDTGAQGDITVNFGTGTAQQAADWVQYMTASSKSNYFGELRAKNGHPEPYNVPYWEVGNEQESSSGENYWRSGSEISIGNGGSQCPSSDVHLCEYIYGGITSFNRQATIGSKNTSVGNGTTNQVFYAQYPPIVTTSQTIYVNGQVWRPINNIADATAYERVYQLNDATGQITFGDGTHGAVLPVNALVTISYRSGPHDGFIQFYNLMKVADPEAKICSSYDYVGFVQIMGSKNPYDCLVTHLYAGQVPSTNSSAVLFHNSLMSQSDGFASTLSNERAEIDQYAGSRAKDISIAVTEYGVNALTYPEGQPNYHRSQDMALFIANTLRVIINAHIPIAEKHFLISYENSQPPGLQTYINSPGFADNALIGGPGPEPILQPSAYVLQAYTKLLYSNLIGSSIKNNPTVVYSGGDYPTLESVATTNAKGQEAIMVLNLSPSNSVTAEVKPYLNNYSRVTAWTLGSNSYLTYDTPSDPSAVSLVKKTGKLSKGLLKASFPPSSITVLQLEK